MNAQSLRVSLELQSGQKVAVLTNDENLEHELVGSLKEIVSPGELLGSKQFLGMYKFSRKPGSDKFFVDNVSGLADASLDVVIMHGTWQLNVLFEVSRVLCSGGLLACFEPQENRTAERSQQLNTELIMAGFIDTTVEKDGNYVKVVSKKPSWNIGTTEGIKLKPKKWTTEGMEDDTLMVCCLLVLFLTALRTRRNCCWKRILSLLICRPLDVALVRLKRLQREEKTKGLTV